MIDTTQLHYRRLVNQLGTTLIQLQRDVYNHTYSLNQVCLSRTSPFYDAHNSLLDQLSAYKSALNGIKELFDTPEKKVLLDNALASEGITDNSVDKIFIPLSRVVDGVDKLPKETWDDLQKVAELILSEVNKPLAPYKE